MDKGDDCRKKKPRTAESSPAKARMARKARARATARIAHNRKIEKASASTVTRKTFCAGLPAPSEEERQCQIDNQNCIIEISSFMMTTNKSNAFNIMKKYHHKINFLILFDRKVYLFFLKL